MEFWPDCSTILQAADVKLGETTGRKWLGSDRVDGVLDELVFLGWVKADRIYTRNSSIYKN